MRTLVISYSFTGNNQALATCLARALDAEYINVIEQKPRTMFTIFLDMLFNRTPMIMPLPASIADQDLVVFAAPVWMGKVAAPLRACLKQLRKKPVPYVFVSVSGGTGGPNTKVDADLLKWTGCRPAAFIDQHIADLFPAGSEPDQEKITGYRINAGEAYNMCTKILEILENKKLYKPVLV